MNHPATTQRAWQPRGLPAALAAVLIACCITPARAQTIAPQQRQRLAQLVGKTTASGEGSLSADEVIELRDLQIKLYAGAETPLLDSFLGQLVWSWAREHGLTRDAAIAELTEAYRRRHDEPPAELQRQLSLALADLPPTGIADYQPPPFLFQAPIFQVRRLSVIGKPPWGPNFNSGMSRLSNGAVGRRP